MAREGIGELELRSAISRLEAEAAGAELELCIDDFYLDGSDFIDLDHAELLHWLIVFHSDGLSAESSENDEYNQQNDFMDLDDDDDYIEIDDLLDPLLD